MLPRSPKGVCVGMAGGAYHVLVPPDHQGIVGHVHLGRRAIDVGRGSNLLGSFAMRTIMAASGESGRGRSCFKMAARTSGRLRGAVGVHWRNMLVPMYLRTWEGGSSGAMDSASSCSSGLSVTHVQPTWRVTVSGVGERSGWGSVVDPCWTRC